MQRCPSSRAPLVGTRWGALATLLLAGARAWLGCTPRSTAPSAQNLILISIDTLRADHLGCYGYARGTSPHLDALARRGVLFADASTASPFTSAAHATMLTGQDPGGHGVRGWQMPLYADVRTLPDALEAEGIRTAAFFNLRGMRRFELDRGFTHYQEIPESNQPFGAAAPVIQSALNWIDEQDARFFTLIHLYDVHSDYTAPREWRERFVGPYEGEVDGTTAQLGEYRWRQQRLWRVTDPLGLSREGAWDEEDRRHLEALYDAGIAQLDQRVGEFVEALEARGLLEDTALIVTSDHGEEFFERGGVLHSHTLYRELVRVPLIVVGPSVPPGERRDEVVGLVDIMPTVLGMLGVPVPRDLQGADLSTLWRTPGKGLSTRSLHLSTREWRGRLWGERRAGVREGRYMLHHRLPEGAVELYDVVADPEERLDLSDREPEVVERMMRQLRAHEERSRPDPPTFEQTEREREQLRALGYIE